MYPYIPTQLKHKTFGELKAIAHEFNIVPLGDRRRRQNWIDAIAGVNPPPFAQQPIIETVETNPGVEVDSLSEPIARQDNIELVGDRWCRETWINAIVGVELPLLQLLEVSLADVQVQESPIVETVEANPSLLKTMPKSKIAFDAKIDT